MTTDDDRPSGFYWISIDAREPEVSFWQIKTRTWWRVDGTHPSGAETVFVLTDMLEAPKIYANGDDLNEEIRKLGDGDLEVGMQVYKRMQGAGELGGGVKVFRSDGTEVDQERGQ